MFVHTFLSKSCRLLHCNSTLVNIDFHFRFGLVSDYFRLDDVGCSGTESNILDCPQSETVAQNGENCGGAEGAGVVCRSGKDTKSLQ